MASLKSSALLVLLAICSLTFTLNAIPGGWAPIENLNNPKIKEMAVFALTEHNRLGATNLHLRRIISGEKQVVAGFNYKLVLAAKSGGKDGDYEAVVYDQPWTRTRKLTSFRKV